MAVTLTFTPTGGGGGASGFRQGKLGGGGHIAGFSFSTDGTTRIMMNDTTGVFFWDSPSTSSNPVADTPGRWRNMMRAENAPAYASHHRLGFNRWNCYSAAVAPNNPTIIYACWPADNADGYVMAKIAKSTDRAATWSWTNFPLANMGQGFGNGNDRLGKPHMAVDPQNPNVVYIGGPTGVMYRTYDGGATWTTMSTSDIPLGTVAGVAGPNPQIAFDGSSALASGRSSKVYVHTGGNGVRYSSDGGATWARLTGGPDHVWRMRVDALGRLYVVRWNGPDGKDLHWWTGSAWVQANAIPVTGQNIAGFDINPFDNNEIMCASNPGQCMRSTDRGVTWTTVVDVISPRYHTDIPWHRSDGGTNEDYVVTVDLKFDPAVNGRLWFSGGIGVWYWDRPSGWTGTPQSFTELTRGNDGLIVETIKKVPNGALMFTVQDRDGFRITDYDAYPSTQFEPKAYGESIRHGWGIDYASFPSPFTSFVVKINAAKTGYSTDDGVTWTHWASRPTYHGGVAVSTPDNFVIFEGFDGEQFYTTNRGATWANVTWKNAALTTLSQATFNRGFFGYYSHRKPVCADRATPGVYYCYKWDYDDAYPGGGAQYAGFYKSTDGGATFIKQAAANMPGAYGNSSAQLKMTAVPGHAGHVFVAPGLMSDDPTLGHGLYFTNNGWASHDVGHGFVSCGNVAVGAMKPGATYPTVYVFGCRASHGGSSNVDGIFRCTNWDGARTWELLTGGYTGTIDGITDIDADQQAYGMIFLAFNSTGYSVGDTAGITG